MEGSVLVHLCCGQTAFLHIGHLDAHFLDNTICKRVRRQDGNLIVDVLIATIAHRSHDGRGINAATAILDEDGSRSLVYLGGIAIDQETSAQGKHDKDGKKIPMVQKDEYQLLDIYALLFLGLLGNIGLLFVCHSVFFLPCSLFFMILVSI